MRLGEVKISAKDKLAKNRKQITNLKASKAINVSDADRVLQWNLGTSVVTRSRDLAKVGSWVFAKSPFVVWF